jgi:hypothetical protein
MIERIKMRLEEEKRLKEEQALVQRRPQPPVGEPPMEAYLPSFDWIFQNIRNVSDVDVMRIQEGLGEARIDIPSQFGEVTHFGPWKSYDGEQIVWTRVELRHGFMIGTEIVWDVEKNEATWTYEGVHCTTTQGAVGILKDRAFSPGGYGNAIYGRLIQEPGTFLDTVENIVKPATKASKNCSDVIFEIKCRAPARPTLSDGVAGDMRTAARGMIAHYKCGKESRWLIPLPLITMTAVWLNHRSFDKLNEALQAMKVRSKT